MRQSGRDLDKFDKILTRVFDQERKVQPDAQEIFEYTGINPQDLMPKSIDHFRENGLTNDIQKLRYDHYENRRKAKLGVVSRMMNESLMSKTAQSRFHQRRSIGKEQPTHSFSKSIYSPIRDAHLLLEKEKEKARKWLKYKHSVNQMALKKYQELQERMTKSDEKEKKVNKVNKETEKKKKETRQNFEKKRENARHSVHSRAHNDYLDRMEKQQEYKKEFESYLNDKIKKEKENANFNFQKMNERIKLASQTQNQWKSFVRSCSREVDRSLNQFDQKLAKSMQKNLQHKIERIRAASAHVERVNETHQQFLNKCSDDEKEKLMSYIEKHKAAEERRMKLNKQRDKNFQKHRKKLENKLETLKQQQDRIEHDMLEKNENLMKKLEEHDRNVQETRKQLQQSIKLKEERDRLRKEDQLENLEREKRNYQRFKFSIMNKHKSISKQVDLIKDTRQELINYKLKRDFELKKHGSLRIPNPFELSPQELASLKQSPELDLKEPKGRLKSIMK